MTDEEAAEAWAKEHCGFYDVLHLKQVDIKIQPGGDLSFFLGARNGFLAGVEYGRTGRGSWGVGCCREDRPSIPYFNH